MRKCPNCSTNLCEIKFHGEIVDKCPTCHGIFFDKGELESISSIVEIFQNCNLDENDIDTISEYEKKRHLLCPDDMNEMYNREIAGITVDICPVCKGIWLDDGEIIALKIAENHTKENVQLYIRLGN